jgi:1-phosphofructokinase/tagatose 6-phosphate kinase
VGDDELQMLREKLQYLSGAVSTVVLAGSLPRKVPTELYAAMISDMTKRKVRTVIDCDGEPLRKALHAQPGLVSAEQREAEALVGHEFQTDEDFQDALTEIASMGAAGVLITLRTGCYALLRSGRGRAHMYRAWIPQVEAVSSVGSGESLLAGFVAAHAAEAPNEECLRRALACGAANSQTVGAGVFDPRDVPRFAAMVEVQEILPAGTRAAS